MANVSLVAKLTEVGPEDYSGAPFILVSIAASLLVGHYLMIHPSKIVQEPSATIFIGVLLGLFTYFTTDNPSNSLIMFDDRFFFKVLLPPIIFTAGYTCKYIHFFSNFTAISLLGLLGTFINFLIIALMTSLVRKACPEKLHPIETLTFAAILSATDSVAVLGVINPAEHPGLFGILAGEGILNDALAIVLFRSVGTTIKKLQTVGGVFPVLDADTTSELLITFSFTVIGSVGIGIFMGAASAYLFHWLKERDLEMDAKRAISILVIFAYSTNMLSEFLECSGIVSLFVCGVMMSHYTSHSLSEETQTTLLDVFETLSHLCEILMFLSLGFYWVHSPSGVNRCYPLLFAMLFIIMFSRAVTVVVICALLRLKFGIRHMIVMWWAGMIRGALAFALSLDASVTTAGKNLISDTTFGLVIITVFVFGGSSGGLIDYLCIPFDEDTEEDIIKRHFSLSNWFQRIDKTYLKKYLGGSRPDAVAQNPHPHLRYGYSPRRIPLLKAGSRSAPYSSV
eukprot:TRINITY_DN17971_c0_g1_i1.p1 TRINITY_DN17971_c0_g1~~TRINITY_DN17971_c0_g1_i1.p1  ORF type:complete len:510 (+),score=45.14 TRINITY_DN17971_c0_g1_i1:234-1763(+)